VKANETSTLYSLDRGTFTHIVKDSSMKRRQQFEAFLSRVELLQELDSYERNSLSDVLVSATYQPGQAVINQGESGDKFFLVEEGEAVAIINKGRTRSSRWTEPDGLQVPGRRLLRRAGPAAQRTTSRHHPGSHQTQGLLR
jgi:hypothetical protein